MSFLRCLGVWWAARAMAAFVLPLVLLPGEPSAAPRDERSSTALAEGASSSLAGSRSASPGFWEAVELDDVDKLQTQMLRGASANARHPEHGPAIVVAARERSPKVLAYLAGLSGTTVDASNPRGETALMLVSLHGDLASARTLVSRGAEVNRAGWTPLHYAAAGGQVELVGFLLEQNAYIDAQSPNRTTPLMMAARQKHTNVVRMLVEAGADPTPRNEAGRTAADYMAANGEAAEAQWLNDRAAEFVARYGTVEKPRTVDGSIVAPGSGQPPDPQAVSSPEPATVTPSPVDASPQPSVGAPQAVPAPAPLAAPPIVPEPPASLPVPATAPLPEPAPTVVREPPAPVQAAPIRPRLPGVRD